LGILPMVETQQGLQARPTREPLAPVDTRPAEVKKVFLPFKADVPRVLTGLSR